MKKWYHAEKYLDGIRSWTVEYFALKETQKRRVQKPIRGSQTQARQSQTPTIVSSTRNWKP